MNKQERIQQLKDQIFDIDYERRDLFMESQQNNSPEYAAYIDKKRRNLFYESVKLSCELINLGNSEID